MADGQLIVEEQRAANLEAPRAVADGASEGAADVAEELALDEVRRDRGAVHAHHRPVAPRGAAVDLVATSSLPVPTPPGSARGCRSARRARSGRGCAAARGCGPRCRRRRGSRGSRPSAPRSRRPAPRAGARSPRRRGCSRSRRRCGRRGRAATAARRRPRAATCRRSPCPAVRRRGAAARPRGRRSRSRVHSRSSEISVPGDSRPARPPRPAGDSDRQVLAHRGRAPRYRGLELRVRGLGHEVQGAIGVARRLTLPTRGAVLRRSDEPHARQGDVLPRSRTGALSRGAARAPRSALELCRAATGERGSSRVRVERIHARIVHYIVHLNDSFLRTALGACNSAVQDLVG